MGTPHEKAYKFIEVAQAEIAPTVSLLTDQTEITTFSYYRIFKNGTYFKVGNNLTWERHFFEEKIDFPTSSKEIFESLLLSKPYYTFWHQIPKNYLMDKGWEILRNLEIGNGFNIYNSEQDFIESFCFSSTLENREINKFYLNHIDLLSSFSDVFRDRIKSLTEGFDPRLLPLCPLNFEFQIGQNFQIQNQEKRLDDLTQHLKTKHLQDIDLRPREKQCLNRLCEGKLVKEVADDLNLSPRTVEFYLMNARKRNGFKTISQLLHTYTKVYV